MPRSELRFSSSRRGRVEIPLLAAKSVLGAERAELTEKFHGAVIRAGHHEIHERREKGNRTPILGNLTTDNTQPHGSESSDPLAVGVDDGSVVMRVTRGQKSRRFGFRVLRVFRGDTHSQRSATSGSTFAARCAGNQLASRATNSRRRVTLTKITGSVDWTSYNWLRKKRLK